MLDTTAAAPGLPDRQTSYKKKLIEVALPLQAINKASAREKSIRHGHPSTLHLWWARRPLAVCRAVLFASLVDDPSSDLGRFPTPEDQEHERKRLFDLIEQLVQWDNSLNERVLSQAREEIRKSVGQESPTIYDPFCGGGAIPIEAQRLGLSTLASDLNPVAVLITKALTEIPWRFKTCAPVHPSLRGPLHERTWERATGLAADVEAYGKEVVEAARERIFKFYPTVRSDDGSQATVIAWLWARTVRCPNPLCRADMPLIKSFALSTKAGNEWALEAIVDHERTSVRYGTRPGKPSRDGSVTRRGAVCIVCNEPVAFTYIRSEGKANRIGSQMIAIVADGPRGRLFLPPNEQHVQTARSAEPAWLPDTDLPDRALGFRVQAYGMTKHRDLFTSRQLLALTTFADIVRDVRQRVLADATAAGLDDDGERLEAGGVAAPAYADAVVTYLAMCLSKSSDYWSSLCTWRSDPKNLGVGHVFARQAISMIWDYAEANPFSSSSGNWLVTLDWIVRALSASTPNAACQVVRANAIDRRDLRPMVVSTDPPYYDNVPYAELSDFFYVWLRPALSSVYPDLFATLLVPKAEELVADPARFANDSARARRFFEEGLGEAFHSIRALTLTTTPTTIFYAFKQTESEERAESSTDVVGRASVGWEAMLTSLLGAGFEIVGTWPMRSEMANRTRGQNSNALASSIVLSCRPRSVSATRCTRSDFLVALRAELPRAVRRLRNASLAATDLEQAALGPGMAVFSRFNEVLEPNGTRMTVRSALTLINQELTQIVLGDIAEVDAETRFALAWFDGHFYEQARYGEAEVLLKAKNANLNTLRDSGALRADRGLVQMLRPSEFDGKRSAGRDSWARSIPAWAQLMFLVAAVTSEDGGTDAGVDALLAIGLSGAERLKDLAYHCYLACDRAKRSVEAQDFNALVTVWPDLQKLAEDRAAQPREQRLL